MIPEVPLAWSLRRRRIFRRCPLEYFLHCHGSGGGFETGVAEAGREYLHFLRNLFGRDAYVNRLLYAGLRDEFYAAEPVAATAFPAAVFRKFEREFADMLNGAPERDHRKPMLRELTCPGADFRAVRAEVREQLAGRLTGFTAKIVSELYAVPPEERREIPAPLAVRLDGLTAYAVPVVAFDSGGILRIVEAGAPEDEAALLHKLYALNVRGRSPERVGSLTCTETGLAEFGSTLSISAARRRIRDDASRWTAFRRDDGTWHEEDFPRAPAARCSACRFRPYCAS